MVVNTMCARSYIRSIRGTFRRLLWHASDAVKPRPRVLGRVACLGHDVFGLAGQSNSVRFLNQQKVRCDLFLEWLGGAPRPRAKSVSRHLQRRDIFPLVWQQEVLPWLRHRGPIEYLFMDSFADLTDQQFVHRTEGWSFAAHYTDLNHTAEFDRDFECLGLLPVEKFGDVYHEFFEWFQERYPNRQAIYLHFPTALDPRQMFSERATALSDTMSAVARKYPFVVNVNLGDDCVEPDADRSFPYHFSPGTYRAFYDLWTSSKGER